jgi:hypothetical protein
LGDDFEEAGARLDGLRSAGEQGGTSDGSSGPGEKGAAAEDPRGDLVL